MGFVKRKGTTKFMPTDYQTIQEEFLAKAALLGDNVGDMANVDLKTSTLTGANPCGMAYLNPF
ncbi:hypothetical protein DPMN_132834 [Dreissena polymorpha]|uniref:Uncharacterized protein n=1 Tax=Dreissena polymorpha TaxID=45954 RepID=A0A9D4JE75_DREPO|nr:hypothetical protein DPMN_132834 [Dreissena polymorpha]